MPVLPGSRNIGPWNKEGEPQNFFDESALEHDRAYNKAQSSEDINKADDEFLSDYWDKTANTPTELFHKYAGIAGIGAKRLLSPITGGLSTTGMSTERAKQRGEVTPRTKAGKPTSKKGRYDDWDDAQDDWSTETNPDSEMSGVQPLGADTTVAAGGGGGVADGAAETTYIQKAIKGRRYYTKKYSKTFYQHFPNTNPNGKFESEIEDITGSPGYKQIITRWYGAPTNHLCMYMNDYHIEREAVTACSYRLKRGGLRMHDFTVLNDQTSTISGSILPIVVPTEQPYFMIAEDPHFVLPYYEYQPCNDGGDTPICDDRTKSVLPNIKFTLYQPGAIENAQYKHIWEPLSRPDVKVTTHHCSDPAYVKTWDINQEFTLLTPQDSTSPYPMPMDPRDILKRSAYQIGQNTKWPGDWKAKTPWKGRVINQFPLWT